MQVEMTLLWCYLISVWLQVLTKNEESVFLRAPPRHTQGWFGERQWNLVRRGTHRNAAPAMGAIHTDLFQHLFVHLVFFRNSQVRES